MKAESKNSHVINLPQPDDIIGYQVNGADYVSQGEDEDDNRFSRYIPVGAFPVVSDQGKQQSQVSENPC